MATFGNTVDLTVLTQTSNNDDVQRIFSNAVIRVTLVNQPGIDPTCSVLDDLVARNVLNPNDRARIEDRNECRTRESQVLKLLEYLKMKDPKSTLAVFIFSLRRNGYANLAKLIHDEWHGEDDAHQNPKYQQKCLPENPLAPEFYGSKPKISLGAGFFALDKKGSIRIKNVVQHAFETKGGDIKLMIDEILLGAEIYSPDYYSVTIQRTESTWPQGVKIRYYKDAFDSKLLIMHVKAKNVYSKPPNQEILKRLKANEKTSDGDARVIKTTFAITLMSTGGISIEKPAKVKNYIKNAYRIVKRGLGETSEERTGKWSEERKKELANGVEKHLNCHIAFNLGIGWRWIIGSSKELFTDSTTRSIKYKENDVVCILWETVGIHRAHIEKEILEKYETFKPSEAEKIIDSFRKTASQAVGSEGALLEWLANNLLKDLMKDYLHESKPKHSWYLFVSKEKLNFSYGGEKYFLLAAEIDDSIHVLLVGFPFLLESNWREKFLSCTCNLTAKIRNWTDKAGEFVNQFNENQINNACDTLADEMSEYSGYHWACILQQSADSQADLFKSSHTIMLKRRHREELKNDYVEPIHENVVRNLTQKFHKFTLICAFEEKSLEWWRISLQRIVLLPCLLLCCPCVVCCTCCGHGSMLAVDASKKSKKTLQSYTKQPSGDDENFIKIVSF